MQTISHKCDVMSYTRYKALLQTTANQKQTAENKMAENKMVATGSDVSTVDMDNVYYLAGFYDPTVNLIKFEGDVKVQGKNW